MQGNSKWSAPLFAAETYLGEATGGAVGAGDGIAAGAGDAACAGTGQGAHRGGTRPFVQVVIGALGSQTSLQGARPNRRKK